MRAEYKRIPLRERTSGGSDMNKLLTTLMTGSQGLGLK